MTEKEFTRHFWNEKIAELSQINKDMPPVSESVEDFISEIDELAVKYEVTSFGYNEHKKGIPGVRATIEVNLGAGNDFLIEINADAKFENNTRIKSTYLELNLIHENNKEFLTNTFFQFLPYTAIEKLLQTMKNLDEEYSAGLLKFRKAEKLSQLTVATIKSMLKIRFENTAYDWSIDEISFGEFLVTIIENGKEISKIIVNDSNCTEKILEWQLQ